MYNPYQGPQYGRSGSFSGFPGQAGGPPGMPAAPWMGGPPGMPGAPGVALPPGVQGANASQPSRPGGLPAGFDPNNMPKIDFSAPVIRLGAASSGKSSIMTGAAGGGAPGRKDSAAEGSMSAGGSNRPGLGAGSGMEQQRQALRESMMSLAPPTKDEIARTVFVGGITDGVGGDHGVERILRSAGNLRKWSRAFDADGKSCRFGFAEYDDPESLGTAVEVLKDVETPISRQEVKAENAADAGVKKEDENGDEDDEKVEMSKLLVVVDENSLSYLEQYQASRGDEDPAVAQARLDTARTSLATILSELVHPSPSTLITNVDRDGDSAMLDGSDAQTAQPDIVTITLPADDELADIPAEMRETVAGEIAAFRDRSTRRDLERLRREEEFEAQERAKNAGIGGRINRLASPPLQAPSGPAGGSNGIPLGPRSQIHGAPSGPKSFQQVPRDYQKGVAFVNGSGSLVISRDDDDDSASDSELERRRVDKKKSEQEKIYLDQERRWLNRERSRTAAVERESHRDAEDDAQQARNAEAVAKRLREWNDDAEAARKAEEYYSDRSLWIRNRAAFRQREADFDERDRIEEARETARDEASRQRAGQMADSFLDRHADELLPAATARAAPSREQPQKFTLALGAAAQRANPARRTVAEVDRLLEDEEDTSTTRKRTLIPITDTSASDAKAMTQDLTPAERDEAIRQLAAEIPTEKAGLWAWPVRWELVDEAVITEKLKPFVEKKIVEYLGVQEQMLVEVVESHVRRHGGAEELVGELEGAMEDEAEALVKKLWRMIIFFSESERRGLAA